MKTKSRKILLVTTISITLVIVVLFVFFPHFIRIRISNRQQEKPIVRPNSTTWSFGNTSNNKDSNSSKGVQVFSIEIGNLDNSDSVNEHTK